MRPYAERKAARIERLRARSAAASSASDAARTTAERMASVIPMGQPILVGHHSEGRDRRYRARISKGFEKSFELAKDAKELERRADAAESNDAISSDDPNAVELLKAKLAEMYRTREQYREVNVTIRTAKRHAARDGVPWEGIAIPALEGIGISNAGAVLLTTPDCFGGVGVAPYQLSNLGANIRRVEARLEQLECKAAAPAKAPEVCGSVRIEENDNRVQLFFPGKPAKEVRDELKRSGFRWAPSEGAWQRMASEQAWHLGRELAKKFGQ